LRCPIYPQRYSLHAEEIEPHPSTGTRRREKEVRLLRDAVVKTVRENERLKEEILELSRIADGWMLLAIKAHSGSSADTDGDKRYLWCKTTATFELLRQAKAKEDEVFRYLALDVVDKMKQAWEKEKGS